MEKETKPLEEVSKIIQKAIEKISAKNENQLCKYIPDIEGKGYLHHFTLKKMKRRHPKELSQLIEQFILHPSSPEKLPPKARARRGTRKSKEFPSLSGIHLKEMIALARNAGAHNLVAALNPQKSLPSAKRELIRSIKKSEIDETLWMNYVDLVTSINSQNSSAV